MNDEPKIRAAIPRSALDSQEHHTFEFDLDQTHDVHGKERDDYNRDSLFDRATGNAGDGARDKFRAATSHADQAWYSAFRVPSNKLLRAVTDEWLRVDRTVPDHEFNFVIYDATATSMLHWGGRSHSDAATGDCRAQSPRTRTAVENSASLRRRSHRRGVLGRVCAERSTSADLLERGLWDRVEGISAPCGARSPSPVLHAARSRCAPRPTRDSLGPFAGSAPAAATESADDPVAI